MKKKKKKKRSKFKSESNYPLGLSTSTAYGGKGVKQNQVKNFWVLKFNTANFVFETRFQTKRMGENIMTRPSLPLHARFLFHSDYSLIHVSFFSFSLSPTCMPDSLCCSCLLQSVIA